MFGFYKVCTLNGRVKKEWISHYCGTCIALKINYGNEIKDNRHIFKYSTICRDFEVAK